MIDVHTVGRMVLHYRPRSAAAGHWGTWEHLLCMHKTEFATSLSVTPPTRFLARSSIIVHGTMAHLLKKNYVFTILLTFDMAILVRLPVLFFTQTSADSMVNLFKNKS